MLFPSHDTWPFAAVGEYFGGDVGAVIIGACCAVAVFVVGLFGVGWMLYMGAVFCTVCFGASHVSF